MSTQRERLQKSVRTRRAKEQSTKGSQRFFDSTGAGTGNSTPQSGTLNSTGEHKNMVIGGRFFLGDKLGKSKFAVVFRGIDSNSGEIVACKRLPLEDLDPEKVANIAEEIENIRKIEHPNLVRIYDALPQDGYLYIVLELLESGSLLQVREKFGTLPDSLLGKYIWNVLKGLDFLHSRGVVHRDIKGVNILLTTAGEVKLADFVQPKMQRADTVTTSQPFWMAPEIIQNNEATPKSDIWSLGCTIIELITGNPPYHTLASMAAVIRIMKDSRPPFPENLSPQVEEFLSFCLVKNTEERKTAKELLDSTWMSSIIDPEKIEKPVPSSPSKSDSSSKIKELEEQPQNSLKLKVEFDIPDIERNFVPSVMLYVFEDTQASAMVNVACAKAGIENESGNFFLALVDNATEEQRRFGDTDLPKVEAQTLIEYSAGIRFVIRAKTNDFVTEGYLKYRKGKKSTKVYAVLDKQERYFAWYSKKPQNRDVDEPLGVIYSFHTVRTIDISPDVDDCFVISTISNRYESFLAEDYKTMIMWVNDLRYACKKHFIFDYIS